MKRNIIKIIILGIVLTIISYITIISCGSEYTTSFIINDREDFKLNVENNNKAIEIIDEKKENSLYIVKIKAKKPGKAYLELDLGDKEEYQVFYVHKSKVITYNSFFGKSTGSEIIPISITIFMLYIFFLLIKKYRKNIKENIYQYKNIAYLGIIVFIMFFILNTIKSIFNYQGIDETINRMITSISSISIILFPIAFITFVLVTISNIKLIMKEGKSPRNLLGLFLGIFICTATISPDVIYSVLLRTQIVNIHNLNSPGPYIYSFLETLLYLTISYLECILVGTIIIAIIANKKKPSYDKDYMIILGCKIKNDGTLTPLLKGRVDKAIEFRNKQLENTKKDLIFIPSGGKGNDEVISEADAMKNYLLEQGIKEKNIIVENKSTNTYENMKLSNKLIKSKNPNIAFSTTNYHVLRAGLIATEQNIRIEGIGSKTKTYYWINAFIREFIGTLYSEKKKHIIVFSIIIIYIIIIVGITYISNNI